MFAVLLFTGACGDDSATSAGPDDTSGATGDMTTSGDASTTAEAPTTTEDSGGDPTTTSGAPTTTDDSAGDPTTTTEATTTTSGEEPDTGATTEADTTTGEPDRDILAGCEAYCDRWAECGLQPDLAACIAGCSDSQSGTTGDCKAANLAVLECTSALSCEALLASLEDGGGGTCSEEHAAADAACQGAGCSQSAGETDDTCEVQVDCDGAPLQQMICDAEQCTCLEGGQEVGQCASEGVCGEGDAVFDKFASCCDFA